MEKKKKKFNFQKDAPTTFVSSQLPNNVIQVMLPAQTQITSPVNGLTCILSCTLFS